MSCGYRLFLCKPGWLRRQPQPQPHLSTLYIAFRHCTHPRLRGLAFLLPLHNYTTLPIAFLFWIPTTTARAIPISQANRSSPALSHTPDSAGRIFSRSNHVNVSPCQPHRLQPDHLARNTKTNSRSSSPATSLDRGACLFSPPAIYQRPHQRSPRRGSHDPSSVISFTPQCGSPAKVQLRLLSRQGNASASAR